MNESTKKILIAAVAALAVGGGSGSALAAGKYKAAYAFCGEATCTDGATPYATPVGDGAGNYYGTASAGGSKSQGAIYRMSFAGGHWKYTRLYNFCSQKKCADGAQPRGGLILDTDGNLYGAAQVGGAASNAGVVYELSPDGAKWKFKVLYKFCSAKDCADGSVPQMMTLSYRGASSGVLYDGHSPLFGTTSNGGTSNQGVVFTLTLNKGTWTEKVIHSFCEQNPCVDGGVPYSGVAIDGNGNLFGTAVGGGGAGMGVIYELSPHGAGWTYTVLHSFCPKQPVCTDGAVPIAAPMIDGAGNLYGTTFAGGSGIGGGIGQGSIYKLVPNGAHSKLTTVHSFCMETNCVDGLASYASVVMDAQGRLFGATFQGGDDNAGTVYRLSGDKPKDYTRLVSFGGATTPGATPIGGVYLDSSGALIGVTATGGANTTGVFFSFTT